MRPLHAALLLTAPLAACAASGDRTPTPAPVAPRALPERWDVVPTWDFERLVEGLGTGPWSEGARLTLALALLPDDETSVRAAVLLAHGESPSAGVLLAHLERREPEALRHEDAAEVVAAAALGPFLAEPDLARRVARLADGERPHPDLEVRVECAAQVLARGDDSVLPFLLRVLRADTPAEREHPIDWAPQTTLAWSKGRAAEALAARAGVPDRFDPDASWAAQNAAADALARALGLAP
jgi:hypothetical protein